MAGVISGRLSWKPDLWFGHVSEFLHVPAYECQNLIWSHCPRFLSRFWHAQAHSRARQNLVMVYDLLVASARCAHGKLTSFVRRLEMALNKAAHDGYPILNIKGCIPVRLMSCCSFRRFWAVCWMPAPIPLARLRNSELCWMFACVCAAPGMAGPRPAG